MEGIDHKSIANILRHFLTQSKHFEVLPITQGLINDSYKISFPDRAYFLQRLNTQIFQNSEDLMFNIGQWQQAPKGSGLPAATFLKTTQGAYFARDEQGHLWRMQTYIPNALAYDIAPDKKIAKEAGRLLGHFHHISLRPLSHNFKTFICGGNSFNRPVTRPMPPAYKLLKKPLKYFTYLKMLLLTPPRNFQ